MTSFIQSRLLLGVAVLLAAGTLVEAGKVQGRLAAHVSGCQPWSVASADRCKYVLDNCHRLSGLVDFLEIHFCNLPEQWVGFKASRIYACK